MSAYVRLFLKRAPNLSNINSSSWIDPLGVWLLISFFVRWSLRVLGLLPLCLLQASYALNVNGAALAQSQNGSTNRSLEVGMLVAQADASEKPKPVKGAEPPKEKTEQGPSKAPAIKGNLASLKPFDEVTKESDRKAGYFDLYTKEEKIWISIKPEQLEQPFFFSVNVPRSVGERGLYGSQMGSHFIAYFHRSGTRIQLIAKNEDAFAPAKSAESIFVEESYSESLLGSADIASQPRTTDQALLIDASTLLFSDIAGYSTKLDMAYRMGFSLDNKNTNFFSSHQTPELTALEVKAHFFVPKLSAPPMMPSSTPMPPAPKNVPDPRSFFVHFYYNFKQLPLTPMMPRLADERVGYFTQGHLDYSTDLKPKSRTHVIKRWRLEKADPTAASSPVIKPIVYWLDKNIPPQYKASVTAGILEWNKAFEKIGLMGALLVKEQGAEDSFNTMDAQHASVRWFTGSDIGFAIGPSQADPRTGEILDADIGMSDVFARSARRQVAEDLGASGQTQYQYQYQSLNQSQSLLASCQLMDQLAHEFDFAQDLLSARGLDMGSPKAERLAQDYIKNVIMHEVGHTLGLRHNFLSSAAYDLERLDDANFTQKYGITSSVMDYTPFNFSLAHQTQGEYVMSTLGPYDYWAIEYGYKPLDPHLEQQSLQEIASRSTQVELAYASDEDASDGAGSVDPLVNRFDLGANPLAYYKKRVQLSQELWTRLQNLNLEKGESFERLTRSFLSGFRPLNQIAPLVAKYLGGERVRRVRAGFGQTVYEPISPKEQREALALIEQAFFAPRSFEFPAQLLNSLATDTFDRASRMGDPNASTSNVSVLNNVLGVQRTVLDAIFSERLAQRVSESQLKLEKTPAESKKVGKTDTLGLAEIYTRVQDSVWQEALQGKPVQLLRRNLQKEHLQRMSSMLLRSSKGLPPEAAGLMRQNARHLLSQLKLAQGKRGLDRETQAHVLDAINTLSESLKANVQRSGL